MHDQTSALRLLDQLLARARRAGADAADAALSLDGSTSVSVRLGQLEDVGRSESAGVSLRAFIGRRHASVSGSDLSAEALDELAQRAVAMAREALEDPFAGLAPADQLFTGPLPDLELDDGTEDAPEALKARALAAEDAARAVPGITNSEGAGASCGRSLSALATTEGFAQAFWSTGHGVSASVVAGEGSAMQRDYAYHSVRRLADLEPPGVVGRRAGERAVARLNPVKLASGPLPILFDPRVATSLLGHLLGAISGPAIARQTSFLLGMRGERVFPAGITIREDPLRPRGLRSRPFDGEGLPTRPRALVEAGVLTTWLLDQASARQLGEAPTGHGSRGGGTMTGNVWIEAGRDSRAALMARHMRALLVTELIGMGVNMVTGDYSRGAAGFLVEGGQIVAPVAEVTIAGNLKDMFAHLTPADDLEFRRGIDSPTLLVEGMTVAGA
jgi:PmbA protein